MKIIVEILTGSRAGQRLELVDPQVVRFGRHPSNEVAFDPHGDRDSSSRHAELSFEDGSLILTDLGSANGTFVDGRRTAARARISSGSTVEFGKGGPRCRIMVEGVTEKDSVPPTVWAAVGQVPPGAARPQTSVGGKVGQRTVRMMIEQALGGAREGQRRLQFLVAGLAVLLFFAIAGVVVVWRTRAPSDAALRKQMVQLMDVQRSAAQTERAELQKKLDDLAHRLGASGGGANIARENHDAIYLVTVRTNLTEEGFCTAFAVTPARLVTNAHCVWLGEDFRRRGGKLFAVQNGHPQKRFAITRTHRIDGFQPQGGISPDVGWLEVEGALDHKVTLATAQEYRRLSTGDAMFTYGFPGRLADVSAPEATFVEGVVGRITTLDGRSGDPAQTQLIQHSAFTTGGTSGSPIFNTAGHVVAVNTGGYTEAQGGGRDPVVSRSLPGYNFGMRVDLVEELLKGGDPGEEGGR